MATIDSAEGLINSQVFFHYDLFNDVLYLRRVDHRNRECFGEETLEGVIVLRDGETDEMAGLTALDWWKNFGQGHRPDSMTEIARQVEVWANERAI